MDVYRIVKYYPKKFGRRPSLLRPATFSEHIQHNKLFRRSNEHSIIADKLAVRDWVMKRMNIDLFPRVFWMGTHVTDSDLETFPDAFVFKANHSWNTNLIVRDKTVLSSAELNEVGQPWLSNDHSFVSSETQYRWIEPRLYVEELLQKPCGGEPDEFKFHCFHGRALIVDVHQARFAGHRRSFFDRDGVRLALGVPGIEDTEQLVQRPAGFDQMIEIAETLASSHRFLRVDFMHVGRPYLSELTLTPGSGLSILEPQHADVLLGQLMNNKKTDETLQQLRAVPSEHNSLFRTSVQ